MSELRMPSSPAREGLEAAAPDGMWIDAVDVRPGMRVVHYVAQADATLAPVVSLVTAVSADMAPAWPGSRGWEVEVHLEGNGECRARAGTALRRATVQPDQPTEVGAVVELDTWADSKRFIYGGSRRGWIDSDGAIWDWSEVTMQGQVHVVVPGMYAIEEAR